MGRTRAFGSVRGQRIIIGGTIVFSAIVLVFQNCSPVNFSQAPGPSTLNLLNHDLSDGRLQIEGGRAATNKKVLMVEFVDLAQQPAQMRIAREDQLVDGKFPDSIPWRKFQRSFSYDLDDQYASDGSKDTPKTLVAELQDDESSAAPSKVRPATMRASILLDTVPPRVDVKGIMKTGLAGMVYSSGQNAGLDWVAADVLAPTGNMAGLDPAEAIQVGWTEDADCSKVLSANLGPKVPDNDQARQFAWPKAAKLDAFYICVYVQDAAGNRSTGLSQPMTAIWRIIAGDNNQGNGGSWKAANVRFGAPNALAMDSKNNLYIYDSDYITLRRVKPDGTIETFLGTGRNGKFLPDDRTHSPMPVGISRIDFDSTDRMYLRTSTTVWRVTQKSPPDGVQIDVETLLTPGDLTILGSDIKTFPDGKEYLLLTTSRADSVNVTYLDAYIYKVPLKDLEAVKTVSKAALGPYKITGSGAVNKASNGLLPAVQDANTAVLPILGTITADSKGRVYVSGGRDSLYGYGEYAILMIDAGKVYKLTSQQHPAIFMGLATFPGGRDFLILHGSPRAVELKWDKLPLSADLPMINMTNGGLVGGIIAVSKNAGAAQDPVFYAPDPTRSKIDKFQGLRFVDEFGRDVFNANDSQAVSAIVARPHGVIEDKIGNVYFAEYLSAVIRKVDPSGNLTLFAGTPFKRGDFLQQVGKDPAVASLGGYLLAYDEAGDRLVHAGNQKDILFLPLTAGGRITSLATTRLTSATLANASPLSTVSQSTWDTMQDKNNWLVRDLQVRSVNGKLEILAWRDLSLPFRSQVIRYAAPFDVAQAGTPELGSELTTRSIYIEGNATSTPSDSTLGFGFASAINTFGDLTYFTSENGQFMVSDGDRVHTLTGAAMSGRAAIFDDSQKRRYLIGLYGQGLRVTVLAPDGRVLKNAPLCLPGTFLNPTDLKLSRDGNSLLVSDGGFNRVIRYMIKENGKVILYQDVAGVCKELMI